MELTRQHSVRVLVQPWEQRVFRLREYLDAGAEASEDLSDANIVFGVKEVAPEYLDREKAYCFFSHTAKGQSYNMPMLRAILEKRTSLFDYELVKNNDGKRLIFFGEYAGYAGMIDTLWALGKRLQWEEIHNHFNSIKYATEYENLAQVRDHLSHIGWMIRSTGINRKLVPLVCGITGYGHVARGAQEILDLFPTQEIEPRDLPSFFRRGVFSDRLVYKVVFRKPDMFAHRKAGRQFDPGEFREYPERYRSMFAHHLPYLTLLVNGIYWEPGFPRLVTRRFMKSLYRSRRNHSLRVIGDITCDVAGSIELTLKTTDESNPVYVHEPVSGKILDGVAGRGPVILAVDKLPTELPKEASEAFGDALLPFVPSLAAVDYNSPQRALSLPEEFRNALIAHRGRLTPEYFYLKQHLTEG